MLPPSCSRCGAPLPAVPADPTHADWCAACAARALDDTGTLPPVPPVPSPRSGAPPWTAPPTASPVAPSAAPGVATLGRASSAATPARSTTGEPGSIRYLDGLLIGTAAAAIAGAAWWAFASITEFEQWPYVAPLVGLICGFGVLVGTRRGGLVPGIQAFALTAVAVAASVYFIDRSLTIAAIEESGRLIDVPLWQGFSFVWDLYESWWDFERQQVLAWCSAPIVAVLVAGWPSRRAPGA